MIGPIQIIDIRHLLPECRRSGLVFCANTQLFGLRSNNDIVAIGGILWYSKKAIIKNLFVLPKYRSRGHFKTILSYLLDLIEHRSIYIIEATCTFMSLHEFLKRGFIITKQYKSFTKVRYENPA